MSNETQPERVSLLDKAWREQKNAGLIVKRTIRDFIVDPDTHEEKPILVEVGIRVISGTEQASMQELLLEKDEEGNFIRDAENGGFKPKPDADGKLGEAAIVAVSTGLSMAEVDEIRRNKSQRFWTALFWECHKYNGVSLAEVDNEKNGDEPDH